MSKRGRILRDPSSNTPGLLVVDGQQFSFSLEGTWRSLTLPKPGLDVDVELHQDGTVSSLAAVSEAQLAREQAEKTLNAAREKCSALASSAVTKFGTPTLVMTGLLVLGWFCLNAVTYDAGFIGRLDFTFWRILGFLNSPNGLDSFLTMRDGSSTGLYGLLAWLALIGPFAGALWKDRRAELGGLLPLAFMVLVAVMARASFFSKTSAMAPEIVEAAQAEMKRGISLGIGAYLSALAGLYLGFTSVKKFFAARTRGS